VTVGCRARVGREREREREREHALKVGHTMEDVGCPVGPTRMRPEGEIWVRGAQPNIGSRIGT